MVINVNLKTARIFIKIRNSFPKHVERLITPIDFHLTEMVDMLPKIKIGEEILYPFASAPGMALPYG